MPDPLLILQASAAPAVLAALGRVRARPWSQSDAQVARGSGALGVGAGLFVGACLLGFVPRFPPHEDQERLLLILLPAAVAVEVVSVFLGRGAWVLRAAVALAAARI